MSWINIKDYQFKEDTYMSVEKVDEAIPSLNQNNIKNFNFKFQNTVIDNLLVREYAKGLAEPIQQGNFIYCDNIEQLKEFCMLFMMRLSKVFLTLKNHNIENVGNSIKNLMACYDEYVEETGNN